MPRPPLPLGKHGEIRTTREKGRWVARCRFRQLDGRTVQVQCWGASKSAANAALQEELRDRAGERNAVLSPGARFREASTIYLAKIEAKREDSTHALYEQWLKTVILPALGELRLRECDVAQMDAFFSDLEQRGYAANTRRVLRAIAKGGGVSRWKQSSWPGGRRRLLLGFGSRGYAGADC